MAEANTEGLPYVPLVPFNGTEAKGGDSLSVDMNLWYQVSSPSPGASRSRVAARRHGRIQDSGGMIRTD